MTDKADGEIVLKLLFSAETVAARIKTLAEEIKTGYETYADLYCVCVLNGAFMFFSDLVKHLDPHIMCGFVRVSSYGDDMRPSDELRLVSPFFEDVKDKNVLIVDDIADSGRTLRFLKKYFSGMGAKSIRSACLIDKPNNRLVPVSPDYAAFRLESDLFVAGYGLDYKRRYRNLSGVYGIE
jgi:hypoxanthine phosphoribosyltransferase